MSNYRYRTTRSFYSAVDRGVVLDSVGMSGREPVCPRKFCESTVRYLLRFGERLEVKVRVSNPANLKINGTCFLTRKSESLRDCRPTHFPPLHLSVINIRTQELLSKPLVNCRSADGLQQLRTPTLSTSNSSISESHRSAK